MERIIITEQDNTSNVEALSSYDVVYVPGFSSLGDSSSLKGVPTLFTSKYEFQQTVGDTYPIFRTDQAYPTEFPIEAIPNATDTYQYTKVFDNSVGLTTEELNSIFTEVNVDEGWNPQPDVTYFKRTDATKSSTTGIKLELLDKSQEEYVDDKPIYTGINPSTSGWFVQVSSSKYTNATDDSIKLDKVYYTRSYTTAGGDPMFKQGQADIGYRYALYLLSVGIPVYYEVMNGNPDEITVEKMYEGLNNRFGGGEDGEIDYSFDSMGDYSIKYLTSGGYPTFEYEGLAQQMIDVASRRTDAVALIDHTNNPLRSIKASDSKSVIYKVRTTNYGDNASYGTMFTPWYNCNHIAVTGGSQYRFDKAMPASLAFLGALSIQLQNSNPWLAVSGVTRGKVPYIEGLHTNQPLTNNVADSYQLLPNDTIDVGMKISINPITYIRNYGYCIWGNRTLRNNNAGTVASSFLNIRNLVSDIKKTLFEASQKLMFEQNTDILWINFKQAVTPLLDTMVSNYLIQNYKIRKHATNPETGEVVPAYKILATIQIQPINSVEVFELKVTLENTDISMVEA